MDQGWFHPCCQIYEAWKALTGSVPTMLNVIADRMGAIYNKYQGVDPFEMLDKFLLKYHVGIQDTFRECKLPFLTPREFLDACQKKASLQSVRLGSVAVQRPPTATAQRVDSIPPCGSSGRSHWTVAPSLQMRVRDVHSQK